MDEITTNINKKQSFIKGTFILSVAAILTKLLSAVYRVPFQNIVGDVGFYIYQQVYPFYGLAVALGTYGFPVIVSKLVADRLARKRDGNVTDVVISAFMAIFCFSLVIFLFLFFGSGFLAGRMGDGQLAPLIKTVSFMFLFLPFISVMRGLHQGIGNMTPTAVSQVTEQATRVILILLATALLLSGGHSLYDAGMGAIVASLIGSFFALVLLAAMTVKKSPVFRIQGGVDLRGAFRLSRRIFLQGLAVSISGLTFILFQMGDAFQLYSLLTETGWEGEEAKILKGIYDRGQPLLQIGIVLVSSLSISAVPVITSVRHRKEKERIDYVRFALQMSVAIGAAATIGLMAIMAPLNTMLFQNDAGTEALRILSSSVLFASVFLTVSSVLQGLGYVYFPAAVVFIGMFGKVMANSFFIPVFGIHGAAIATSLSLLFMSVLSLAKLRRIIGKQPVFQRDYWGSLGISLVFMGLVLFSLFSFLEVLEPYIFGDRLFSAMKAVLGAVIGGIVFLVTAVRTGLFKKDEIGLLPFGNKLRVLIRK